MPASRSLDPTIWASDLVEADVVSSQGSVARVTGLVVSPPKRVLALRVLPVHAASSTHEQDEQLLLFDAAQGYTPGRVRVLSADDFVAPAQVPSLAGHLTSQPFIGSAIRAVTGNTVGYLWDALIHCLSGEFIQYRIGAAPRSTEGAPSVLTSCQLYSCLQGELIVQDSEADFLCDLLGRVLRSA